MADKKERDAEEAQEHGKEAAAKSAEASRDLAKTAIRGLREVGAKLRERLHVHHKLARSSKLTQRKAGNGG